MKPDWKKENPERWAAYMRGYRATHPGYERRIGRSHFAQEIAEYGITEMEYWSLLYVQEGKCAICRQPETATYRGKVRRLAIDHDHWTGVVRGLLCSSCNLAIGLFKESPETLWKALAYVA